MLCNEKNYEFRQRIRIVHKKDMRDYSLVKENGEFEILDGINIVFINDDKKVVYTACCDFADYLETSMGISAFVTKSVCCDKQKLVFKIDESIEESYIISFDKDITVVAKDERMAAQALYCLEDKMNARHAPYIKNETIKHTFLFSPRMIHSGYQIDTYPDEHLASIAHCGMDAILVFVKEVNITTAGFVDFNDLIDRAAKYGIDVYAYSYFKSLRHPDDEDAEAHYESTYGRLFEACPGFKGVILVGESVGFPSKDEHVSANSHAGADGIPFTKPRPGWWPCKDYPEWLNCVKKVVRKHKPDADIVFWTYNWGDVEEEYRVKLINTLPTDITLQATYEMFENYKHGNTTSTVCDYTLAFEGPGKYFESEAKAAKARGIKLYAMSNTGGLTWDMGTIPYQPMPYQWMRRYKSIRECNSNYGLCGLMESHHYGLWPSFISDLAKQCYIKENVDFEANLSQVLKAHYKDADIDVLKQALNYMSDASRCYTPSSADQYGAFRVGPSYPLCLTKEINVPSEKFAHFGNSILCPMYPAEYWTSKPYQNGPGIFPILRVLPEIELLEQMRENVEKALELMYTIENKNDELLRLINLCEYIKHIVITGTNSKRFYYVRSKLNAETDPVKFRELIEEAKKIILEERQNALDTIPIVEKDSRLGWEPSMEYIGDKEHILWKVKHADYVLDYEIGCYKAASDEWWFK